MANITLSLSPKKPTMQTAYAYSNLPVEQGRWHGYGVVVMVVDGVNITFQGHVSDIRNVSEVLAQSCDRLEELIVIEQEKEKEELAKESPLTIEGQGA